MYHRPETELLHELWRVDLGMCVGKLRRQARQLGAGGFDVRPVGELRKDQHVVIVVVRAGPVERPRNPKVDVEHAGAGGENADNAELGLAKFLRRQGSTGHPRVEPDGSAHDIGIAAEAVLPVAVGEHRNARGTGVVVRFVEDPAEHGPRADQTVYARGGLGDPGTREAVGCGNACPEVLRSRNVGQRCGIVAEVEVLRGREPPLGTHSRLGNRAAQDHQPIRVRVAERIQQNLLDEGEYGDGGAEADAQTKHREHGESGRPPQASQRLPKVEHHAPDESVAETASTSSTIRPSSRCTVRAAILA